MVPLNALHRRWQWFIEVGFVDLSTELIEECARHLVASAAGAKDDDSQKPTRACASMTLPEPLIDLSKLCCT